MSTIRKTTYWILFALAAAVVAMLRSSLDGDGIEYLLMAHAFATDGSPALTPADFEHIARLVNSQFDPAGQRMLLDVVGKLDSSPAGLPYFGFARTASGEIYSIHFWLYSLLAAPLYAAVTWLNLRPWLCFPLLNLALLCATLAHLHRSLPSARRAAALLFLSLGTVYYLRWTGPEVLTACCAFSAAICVLRRDTGLAICLAGIGATQNPSLALVIPLFAVHGLAARRMPALAPLAVVRRSTAQALCLGGAGLAAALAPYLFYYSVFGVPSVIAPYFTDTALITPRRAWSFLFDLNQGMLAGIPGLAAGLAAAVVIRPALDKRAGAANALFFVLACCVMAAPALAAINWNSAASVMLRYAYWAAMPLVACLVSMLPSMAAPLRTKVVAAVIVAQCLAVLGSGQLRRTSSYVHHTPLAEWALAAFPGQVNPDPEIFIERGKHSEASITLRTTQLFHHDGVPVKLLRHWANSSDSAGLCGQGQQVSARSVVEVDGGWQYLNGSLACVPASAGDMPMRLRFAGTSEARSTLDTGWAGTEPAGTWTNAPRSVIRIRIPPGREATGLLFTGHYFNRVRASDVRINGKPLGTHSLGNTQLPVPPGVAGSELVIELRHANAASPAQLGLSGDTRVLAYYLNEVQVRLRAVAPVGSPARAM